MSDTRVVEVPTSHGRLRGLAADGVCAFKGVPYGGSTAGAARFRPPGPVEPWRGVRDALDDGPACPQVDLAGGARTATDATAHGEDCLVLNVWTPTPDSGAGRPVMVWLHGGGLHAGSASSRRSDGAALARHGDVVVVGVNHRLGVLGLLHLAPTMGAELASAGMVTFLDLVAALEWVRDEIAAFGGDPGNVTLFGQSGGGQKVGILLATPAAQGRVHRAVLQSGSARRVGTRMDPAELAGFVLDELGVAPGDLEHLQALPVEQVVQAAAVATDRFGAMVFNGVVDGVVLPAQPHEMLARGLSASVPVLLGTTADEFRDVGAAPGIDAIGDAGLRAMLGGVIGRKDTGFGTDGAIAAYRSAYPDRGAGFLFGEIFTDYAHMGVEQTADAKVAVATAPVHRYLYAAAPAHHGAELPHLFRSRGAGALTDTVSDTWVAFARSGDPATPRLPEWPAYDLDHRATMVLDATSRVADDPFAVVRARWATIDSTL